MFLICYYIYIVLDIMHVVFLMITIFLWIIYPGYTSQFLETVTIKSMGPRKTNTLININRIVNKVEYRRVNIFYKKERFLHGNIILHPCYTSLFLETIMIKLMEAKVEI